MISDLKTKHKHGVNAHSDAADKADVEFALSLRQRAIVFLRDVLLISKLAKHDRGLF